MQQQGYDIIGDIHGHGTELLALLEYLGYQNTSSGYCHPERKVVFLGDFIDRGPEQRLVLDTVMPMVRNGHAHAVMGNHELNALAFHTQHNGRTIREHSDKNLRQHRAFLDEYGDDPTALQQVLEFFYELPLWLELEGIRVVHACWDQKMIALVRQTTASALLSPDLLVEVSTEGTDLYDAVETLLKGYEVPLPDNITFPDKEGHPRDAVRIGWWDRESSLLGEVVQPVGTDIRHAAELPIPESAPRYDQNAPPCFIGHYWLSGKQDVLAHNVACLDYSVAKGGRLVAYRWSGERQLTSNHFSYVGQE